MVGTHMSDTHIYYRSGYKYQLAENYTIKTTIKPKKDIESQFIDMNKDGTLSIKSGYAWDGTSGPIIDDNHNQRASLVHDALYQLMRQKKLSPRSAYKDKADRLFQKLCKQDGVLSPLADLYYQSLKRYGDPAADPKNAKEIQKAP